MGVRSPAISPLWILPVLVVAAGIAALSFAARRLAEATRDASSAVDGLRTVGDEAASLREEADAVLRRGRALADLRRRAAEPE